MIKFNKEEFIEKAKEIHGDKYDYSLLEYKNNKTKIKIICKYHGIFEQTTKTHLSRNGCAKCKAKSLENFILEARKIHGDLYDYSIIEYKNNYTKIEIICKKHGGFNQVPYAHLRGQGCKKCHFESKRLGQKEFIDRCIHVHNNKYDYKYVKYTHCKNKIKIICPMHGLFLQIADDHQRGIGCQQCKSSKGERIISQYLTNNKIKFITQKKFKSCVNVKELPFDFYLDDLDILIEFQGEQHFEPRTKGRMYGASNPHEEYLKIKKNDNIKKDWCQVNGEKLIVIHYKDIKRIEEILDNELKK
jgi:hypothetical protein